MLPALMDLLFPKLCWQNVPVPSPSPLGSLTEGTDCYHMTLPCPSPKPHTNKQGRVIGEMDSSRLYEVLPMDIPPSGPTSWSASKQFSRSKSCMAVPPGSSTYSVPRGINGTPPSSCVVPPAVPPRNKNMTEGERQSGTSSLGTSPNDKRGSLSRFGQTQGKFNLLKKLI